MTLIRWKPLHDVTPWNTGEFVSDFANMQREFDKAFNSVIHGGTLNDGSTSTWLPVVDILEHENEYKVHVELPGVKKEDVKITVVNGTLTIRGEKKSETDVNDKNYRRTERSFGSFQRSFSMPSIVKSAQIEASYQDGILTITLPKLEEAKPKEIEVKVK